MNLHASLLAVATIGGALWLTGCAAGVETGRFGVGVGAGPGGGGVGVNMPFTSSASRLPDAPPPPNLLDTPPPAAPASSTAPAAPR